MASPLSFSLPEGSPFTDDSSDQVDDNSTPGDYNTTPLTLPTKLCEWQWSAPISSVALSPSPAHEQHVLAALVGESNKVLICDVDTRKVLHEVSLTPFGRLLYQVRFSSSGRLLAMCGTRQSVAVLRVGQLARGGGVVEDVPRVLGQEEERMTCVAFTPNEKSLVVGSGAGMLYIAGVGGEDRLCSLRPLEGGEVQAHQAFVRCVVFGHVRKVMATCSDDHCLHVWDVSYDGNGMLERPRLQLAVELGPQWVSVCAFSRDDALVACSSEKTPAFVCDARTGALLWMVKGAYGARALAFGLDRHFLILGTTSGQLAVHQLGDPGQSNPIARLSAHHASILSLAVSRDGALLASGSPDHRCSIWSLPRAYGASAEQLASLLLALHSEPSTTPAAAHLAQNSLFDRNVLGIVKDFL